MNGLALKVATETMLDLRLTADFDYRSAEFAELFEKSDVTAFQHPAWQSAMKAHLANLPGFKEQTLVIRNGADGMLLGTLPIVSRKIVRARILEYANMGLVDYAMPTLRRDFASFVPDMKALSEGLSDVLGRYDMLRIKHMPTNDPLFLRLFPNSYLEKASFSAHAAHLKPDYDEWRMEAISKSERKHRDKKRRAMMRGGEWEMKRLYEPDEILNAFEYMRFFHRARYSDRPGVDMIQDPDAFNFYVKLATDETKTGFARVYQFTYDDQVVAVQFGISHANRYLYLMMGVDFERMGRFSPGLLMTEDIIRDCIKDGYEILDLTVGDEPYKTKFGTTPTPIYTLWHADSMLGIMGRSVADIVQRGHIPERLKRWVT